MPFDGAGNFSREYNWVSDRDNGIAILASRMDGEFDNFANAMNVVFFRSGLVPMTGNLKMGSYYLTGLGAGNTGALAVRFQDDANTGLMLNGTGKLALVSGSTIRAEVSNTGLDVTGVLGVSGNATVGGTFGATGAATFGNTLSAPNAAATLYNLTVRGGAGEGGQITLNSIDNSFGVYNFDVDNANNARLFTTVNNTNITIGQLSGTGGQVILFAGGAERFRTGPVGQIGLSGANYGSNGQVLTSQGAGSAAVWTTPNAGTVTSVSGTGTVSGLTLTGTVTGSGNLTLGGSLTLTSGQITTGLGFTPYNSTNPNGYTSNVGTVTSVSGTGSANGLFLTGTVTGSGNISLAGTVTSVDPAATINSQAIGTRKVLRRTTTTTLVAADAGGCVALSAGITVPNSVFGDGDAVTLYNDSASPITITQGAGFTLRQVGTANTGNRTLAQRGLATIWFNSASEGVISGGGLT